MRPDITVAISVYRAERYIRACLHSILAQTIRNFEILIVEDPPFDRTKNIIDTFEDKRIRHLRNQRNYGLSKSRNQSVELARGKYIFFTDADCIVSKNWIEQGLNSFHDLDCIGVEGKTYYVSRDYKSTFSDGVIENSKGGQFMTCNIAYKKSVLENIGGFDEMFTYLEDRDLALRAIKLGRICFNPEMIVYHQKITLKPTQFVQRGKRIRNWVLLYKKFREKTFLLWRIVRPLNLMAILFPPLILVSFFHNSYRTKEDFVLFPFIYVKLIYERLNLWDMCISERVFLI